MDGQVAPAAPHRAEQADGEERVFEHRAQWCRPATHNCPPRVSHPYSDHDVPYVESAKHNQALASNIERGYAIADVFEHVQSREATSWGVLREFTRLCGFVWAALGHP
jgi:hypothetical protein